MFWAPCGSWEGKGGWGHLGVWGVSPTHTCMYMHTHTCIHVKKLQMAPDMEASIFSMFIMFNMHVRVWMHACACVCTWDTPHTPIPNTHPHPPPTTTPSPPPGRTLRIRKNSITLDLIKIFQIHLKI